MAQIAQIATLNGTDRQTGGQGTITKTQNQINKLKTQNNILWREAQNAKPAASTAGNGDALLDYFREQNEIARQQALAAIQAKLNAQVDAYNTNLGTVNDQYQSLINQSEVNRYRSARQVRENQSNRGQLDSGLGRQEFLNLDTKYGNQLNNIKLQRQSARDDIANAVAQLRAQAEAEKASTNNQYNQLLAKYAG